MDKSGGSDALAAAGFKKSIVKKSISIKIKSSEQSEGVPVSSTLSTSTQLTDVQKQQQAISNKLKQLAKKQKEEPVQTSSDANKADQLKGSILLQQQYQQQQMNGAEQLRAQYNQYQNSLAGGLMSQPPPGMPPPVGKTNLFCYESLNNGNSKKEENLKKNGS